MGDRGWRHVFAGDWQQLRQRQADPWEGRTWAKGKVQGDNRRSINVVAEAVTTKFEDIAQLASAELGFRQEGCGGGRIAAAECGVVSLLAAGPLHADGVLGLDRPFNVIEVGTRSTYPRFIGPPNGRGRPCDLQIALKIREMMLANGITDEELLTPTGGRGLGRTRMACLVDADAGAAVVCVTFICHKVVL